MNLNGKVAVISGGASGLGLATAQKFIEAGANVAILDINEVSWESIDARYTERTLYFNTDVTQPESVETAMQSIANQWGRIDVCVNCAGVVAAGKVIGKEGEALALKHFTRAIDINLNGTFNVLRVAAEYMAKNDDDEKGVIINTASVAAFDGQTGQAAYSASKAAIAGMTLPLARDLAPYQVRVMTIAPGLFNTPMMESLPEKVTEPLIQMVQHPKRFGLPSEFAQLCQHIVENPYLNGEVIRLDAAIRMEPK